MSDQSATTTDTAGITRGPDGTIQEPGSNQNTNQGQTDQTTQATTDSTTKSDGTSLLNQKEDDKQAGAPEKYADFKLPDGLEFVPEKLQAATAIFKEVGLTQEGAQKLVDLYAKELTEAAEAPVKHWMDLRQDWQRQVSADPEIGGKLKEVKTIIGRAIDTLGPQLSKEFREAMDLTGAGDNPAFVKAFYKFASQLTEGRHVQPGGPSQHGQQRPGAPNGTGAAAMYPNLPSAGR